MTVYDLARSCSQAVQPFARQTLKPFRVVRPSLFQPQRHMCLTLNLLVTKLVLPRLEQDQHVPFVPTAYLRKP